MAVLVSKSTSAGNVFLAAALQDNHRAVVVGEPTGGETYVNSFVSIPGQDDRLRLAVAVMLRSDGTPLLPTRFPSLPIRERTETQNAKRPGFVMPDHVVAQPASAEQQPNADPMLAKAIEVLKIDAAQASFSQNDKVPGE